MLPSSPLSMKFLMRMLAKVPRIITSWLPRRVPYWLKSATPTPCSVRYLPAGGAPFVAPARGTGGRGRLDRTGRRDVIGGDLVAEEAEPARALDAADRSRLAAHADEIGRVL